MSSEFGRTLRVGVFGQSHGAAIGVSIDGLPAGERIDLAELQAFLDRRKPGKSPLSTARKEADAPEFLSGLRDGVTCGSPLCAVIYNSDQHSSDYTELADKPRPSHADYTAWVKWGGQADMRGGGHFSGRLTAPLCIAGGIAKQILVRRGVFVGAHLAAVGTEDDEAFPLYPTDELFRAVAAKFSASPPSRAWSSARASALHACAEAKTTTPSAWRTAASSRRRTAPAASSAASPPVCRSRFASASSRRRPSADRRKRSRSRGWKTPS